MARHRLGVGGRHDTVALAEYGAPGKGVHQTLHHRLPRAQHRGANGEGEVRGISPGGSELVGGRGMEPPGRWWETLGGRKGG
jgi:hypothetical protein